MRPAICVGKPRFHDQALERVATERGILAAWQAGFLLYGTAIAGAVSGPFALALPQSDGRIFLAVDRFGIHSLCYRVEETQLHFSQRANDIAPIAVDYDSQAMFDYLYFHVIPAPRTIFRRVQRLPAGHYALFEDGRLTVARWWNLEFDENHRESFESLRERFRELLHEATKRQISGVNVGCFLSGGTDSSTVAGILGEVSGNPARTFSIGFDAKGYDEMEFARIAARHFRTEHHEHYVTPDELVEAIPLVAASYDQPFGNSSVVPSYYCARLAREAGVDKILGGDGGDELFGGNTRYAKQRVFDAYEYVPAGLREMLVEPVLIGDPRIAKMPGLRKVASYVEQARVPMPARMQTYNLLMRLGVREVLDPNFLANVDVESPGRQQSEIYGASGAHSLVNRMLAFDWRYTLAENDLPKVVGATSLAGIAVGFPLLDDDLVDFSLRLEPRLKLRGLQLRWFFKEALRGFLPNEIITKKKHGFGLPFGVWVNETPRLRALAQDSIDMLRQRGIVRPAFLDRLMHEYLPLHPGYYGEMVWILMMLGQWMHAQEARSECAHRSGGPPQVNLHTDAEGLPASAR